MRRRRHDDAFDLVVLDDLGYVQQSVDEAEVLFMDAGEARLSAAVVQRAVRAEFLKLGSLVHANGWSEEPSELDFEEGEARWAR